MKGMDMNILKIGSRIQRRIRHLSAEKPPDLKDSQYWSLRQLEELQNRRLGKIISYAYKRIPGYRKKFDEAGIKPQDVRTKEDLWKVPTVNRDELQNNDIFVNRKLVFCTLYTGGSTGTALQYYDSVESYQVRRDAHLRGWSWNGYSPEKRLAVISSAQGVVEGENTINLAGDLTTDNLEKNVEVLLQSKSQYLRGYASSLFILAKFLLDKGIQLKGIKSVNSISENLYDFQRTIMEEAFDCRVFEEYCCNDGGACAWECESHEGLHYYMERAIVEEVDGEMVVTDLWNRAMPFIRYRNGDSVEFLKGNCGCGRELPLIRVRGRTNDILISRDGPVSPSFLVHHGIGLRGPDRGKNEFFDEIRALQYIQKPGYILEVNVAPNSSFDSTSINRLHGKLSELMHGMDIRIHITDDIPVSRKGTRHFIINEDTELLEKCGFGRILHDT
jgi:phenylacetate-CoA ligase